MWYVNHVVVSVAIHMLSRSYNASYVVGDIFALQITLLSLRFRLAASVNLLVHFAQLARDTKPHSLERRHDGAVPVSGPETSQYGMSSHATREAEYAQEHADSALVFPVLWILASRDGLCEKRAAEEKARHADAGNPRIVEQMGRGGFESVDNVDGVPEVEARTSALPDLLKDYFGDRCTQGEQAQDPEIELLMQEVLMTLQSAH